MSDSIDKHFMRLALNLARRGLGLTAPNPSVGAVIVAPGATREIIGVGNTAAGGRPHAETIALNQAGARAKGATIYVTLEPCAHVGRTQPCAEAIIEGGIKRVVCAMRDPDERVAGQGINLLNNAGIEVVCDVLRPEACRLNLGHVLRVTKLRPAVVVKLAVSSDGLIAAGDGQPVWVTGALARDRGHLMRARNDAILVGSKTIMDDDPSLTCRLPGLKDASPLRVILNTRLNVPPGARIFTDADKVPVWVICSDDALVSRQQTLRQKGAVVIRTKTGRDNRLDLKAALSALAEKGVTRLMIEGGPTVAGAFMQAGLADEVVIFQGDKILAGGGRSSPPYLSLSQMQTAKAFDCVETRWYGPDRMHRFIRRQ